MIVGALTEADDRRRWDLALLSFVSRSVLTLWLVRVDFRAAVLFR
jgi:hypothetical protein